MIRELVIAVVAIIYRCFRLTKRIAISIYPTLFTDDGYEGGNEKENTDIMTLTCTHRWFADRICWLL